MNEEQLQDVIESKKAHIRFLEGELANHKEMLQKDRADWSAWDKEHRGMCRAVTRANKARNAMGRWTVAIQNENDLLRLMLKDRGINADFMWKAKKAMEKLTRIEDIFHAEFEWWNTDEVYRALRTIFEEVLNAE